MAVGNTTRALKDIMRIDSGINGDAQYIEQITWMLFLKAFDYKEQEWELIEKDYYPVIPNKYRWSNWAQNDEGHTGEKLLKHVDEMFATLREIDVYNDPKGRKRLIRDIMLGVNNFMKSGTQLRQVINKINKEIHFGGTGDSHLFNDLYETMLKGLQSAGKAGEFYTPRPVTNFIVEMIDPQLGETVLDPACGTGGFLTSTIDRFSIQKQEEYRTLQRTIKGIEKKPFPFLLCVTNLISHGIDVPQVKNDNTLRTPVSDYTSADKVDVIVTNPPFGGAEEKAISQSVPAELRNTETADLFLVHIMELLNKNGRCGLVLPDGFMFGTGVKSAIKKKLLEVADLHTIVRLPKDVFAPYTNINTNLLFFQKGKQTKGVWYYRMQMPEGYKHFSKTRPMLDKHFDPVREWWANRTESEQSQYIPVEDIIAADYSLDFCGYPHDTVEILPPEEFIAQYLSEKTALTAKIENVLARISSAMEQEDAV